MEKSYTLHQAAIILIWRRGTDGKNIFLWQVIFSNTNFSPGPNFIDEGDLREINK